MTYNKSENITSLIQCFNSWDKVIYTYEYDTHGNIVKIFLRCKEKILDTQLLIMYYEQGRNEEVGVLWKKQ